MIQKSDSPLCRVIVNCNDTYTYPITDTTIIHTDIPGITLTIIPTYEKE